MKKSSPFIKPNNPALMTDLYQFTMAASYFHHEMFAPATFSLFIRKYPLNRGYFVNAGLEEVLEILESFRFEEQDIDYLGSTGLFSQGFLHFLGKLRFTGDVFAMPEGRIFFVDEPVLEVTAPIIEAQLVETLIINAVNFQVSIATKASRCVRAAKGRSLVDFSLRRTQGFDAGLKVARASFIGGFSGTSNVLAGKVYGVPVSGTMAHSFVISFEEEIEAFRAFSKTFPENSVLLIDTYDTIAGAHKAAKVGKELRAKGYGLKGVRLDSGDMAQLSQEVRKILRGQGLKDTSIFASGAFDEYKIEEVLQRGAQIDALGVGTKMGVSSDAPYADMAYKLVKYGGRPVLKLSTGKRTLVDEKQVFRECKNKGLYRDTVSLRDENGPGEPLLSLFMKNGRRIKRPGSLSGIRGRFLKEFGALGERFKAIRNPELYPAELGPGLKEMQKRVVHEVVEKELGES